MKIKRIVIFFAIILILLINSCYAKYIYNFDETVITLTKDIISPVCMVSYSTQEWTNKNVIITITANEKIEQVSGFVLSQDEKVLTKEVSQNEYGKVVIRDFSGNETEVEYNVSNIDKELPKIIGCENGGTYNAPVGLDYTDNVGIKEIYVDRYDNDLSISSHGVYYDSFAYCGIDRTSSTITVQVDGHPKNTKKYRYYINNRLYTTTQDTKYIFTGLNKGTNYVIKVEAIDKNGQVLASKTVEQRTSYFGYSSSTKTSTDFCATLSAIDSSVANIRYAVWNYYDEEYKIWYEPEIKNGVAQIKFSRFNTSYYPSFVIHAYFFDANSNVLAVEGFSIDLQTGYVQNNYKVNPYKLTQSGNYQIIVNDLAGNEVIYYIKVK